MPKEKITNQFIKEMIVVKLAKHRFLKLKTARARNKRGRYNTVRKQPKFSFMIVDTVFLMNATKIVQILFM